MATAATAGILRNAIADTATVTSRPRVVVCLPTYNEAEHVETMLTALVDLFDREGIDGRVLVIDDDSPDGTGRIADGVAHREKRVSVLHRPGKEGLGRAYRAGFRVALDAGADLIVEMDCDFSHDPAALPELLEAANHAHFVLGSRYVAGGSIGEWGPIRRVVSRVGCWYARRVLGVPVQDLTGGFKCFRREVLESLPLDEVDTAGYGFQIDMTFRALEHGYVVREVPITFTDRQAGQSKMSWRITLEAVLAVPAMRMRAARTRVATRRKEA